MLHALPDKAKQLVIRRVTPKTQTVDLHDNMILHAELIEAVDDKATMEIQEVSQQNIHKDDLEIIKGELNQAIEDEAQTRETNDNALQQNINTEAQERASADAELRQAIAADDAGLRCLIAAESLARKNADTVLAVKLNETRYNFNYLLQIIIASLGLQQPNKVITESGDFLITESGDRVVTPGRLAPNKITTESGCFWVTESRYQLIA
jgi:hypothetical protein